jgi:hypothetical protein
LRVLRSGTFLWATVRSTYTLILAPLAGAALLQDTRYLGTEGAEIGRVKWLYADVALFFPPVSVVYLSHRRRAASARSEDGSDDASADGAERRGDATVGGRDEA